MMNNTISNNTLTFKEVVKLFRVEFQPIVCPLMLFFLISPFNHKISQILNE